MVRIDSLLRGRYRLDDKIAGGGMGTVFAATDEKLNRKVAVKVLADHLAGDENFVERFRREAQAAAGLAHPNIATVYDYGEEDGCHFIVMEIARGRDLARVVREEGPLPPNRVAHIVGQICAALGHAHAAGIVHRDVKPANVILNNDDHVKVTDFGIARAAGDSKLTLTGTVLGTAHYISPEQANGESLTPSSDIYSLGVVTYELLTGALPFTGESLMAVAMRHVTDDVPRPSELNPSVPPAMDDAVERATHKDPRARFSDTSEMARALSSATDTARLGAGTTTPMPSARQTIYPIPGERWDPGGLGRKVLFVFGALLLIAIAFLVWRVAEREPVARTTERRAPGGAPLAERTPTPQDTEAANLEILPDVIGDDFKDVEKELVNEGLTYKLEFLGGEDLDAFILENGVNPEDAEKDEVIGTDPPPGVPFAEGQTITLYVSHGIEDSGDEEHGKNKGHEKKDDD